MEEKNKKRGVRKILNIFDIAVILLAAAVLAFLYVRARAEKKAETVAPIVSESSEDTVRYVIELTPLYEFQLDQVKPGQEVIDYKERYDFGVVEAVESGPATVEYKDLASGVLRTVPAPDTYTLRVTVKADCIRTGDKIYLDGDTLLYEGEAMAVVFSNAFFDGRVIGIERSED